MELVLYKERFDAFVTEYYRVAEKKLAKYAEFSHTQHPGNANPGALAANFVGNVAEVGGQPGIGGLIQPIAALFSTRVKHKKYRKITRIFRYHAEAVQDNTQFRNSLLVETGIEIFQRFEKIFSIVDSEEWKKTVLFLAADAWDRIINFLNDKWESEQRLQLEGGEAENVEKLMKALVEGTSSWKYKEATEGVFRGHKIKLKTPKQTTISTTTAEIFGTMKIGIMKTEKIKYKYKFIAACKRGDNSSCPSGITSGMKHNIRQKLLHGDHINFSHSNELVLKRPELYVGNSSIAAHPVVILCGKVSGKREFLEECLVHLLTRFTRRIVVIPACKSDSTLLRELNQIASDLNIQLQRIRGQGWERLMSTITNHFQSLKEHTTIVFENSAANQIKQIIRACNVNSKLKVIICTKDEVDPQLEVIGHTAIVNLDEHPVTLQQFRQVLLEKLGALPLEDEVEASIRGIHNGCGGSTLLMNDVIVYLMENACTNSTVTQAVLTAEEFLALAGNLQEAQQGRAEAVPNAQDRLVDILVKMRLQNLDSVSPQASRILHFLALASITDDDVEGNTKSIIPISIVHGMGVGIGLPASELRSLADSRLIAWEADSDFIEMKKYQESTLRLLSGLAYFTTSLGQINSMWLLFQNCKKEMSRIQPFLVDAWTNILNMSKKKTNTAEAIRLLLQNGDFSHLKNLFESKRSV